MNNNIKNYSLLLIKPDAVIRNLESDIVKILESNNFAVLERKEFLITEDDIVILYHESKAEKHFNLLVDYLNGEKVVALKLNKENCVDSLNSLVGVTDPRKANSGTIRNIFGIDILRNSVHSSNDNRVDLEIDLIFNK